MSYDRRPSRQLTFDDAVLIWILTWRGCYKHRIAAYFDVNIARVYEIYQGKRHPESKEAARLLWEQGFRADHVRL